MKMVSTTGLLFVAFLTGFGSDSSVARAQKTPYKLCSRIVAIQETASLNVNDALKALEATESDPVGCLKRKKPLGPKNGLQVSGCQDVSVLLEGQNSVFALKLEIEDRSGSLRAFQTDLQTEDGSREKTVCFQHNVPMGSSEFADDSPRCIGKTTGLLVMYVTKTCPEALDVCVDNWLVGVEGDCDGPATPTPGQKPVSKTPQVPPTRQPSGGRESSLPPQQVAAPTIIPPTGSSQVQSRVPAPLPPVSSQPPAQGDIVIPSDLPEDISLPGLGQPGPPPPVRRPSRSQPSSDALQISLCFRMFSTTDKVDRSTCIGFGPMIQDPIRCKEDASFFKPELGIAYTPCAELNAHLVPGTPKQLLNLSIGGRPGKVSAKLDEDFGLDRPLCIFIEVDGKGVFPKKGESGCLHPWEPVSIFAGKTCRVSGVCSYHSLMVSGGGCQAPRLLPSEDLEGLKERDNDLTVGFGEPGSKTRYGTPKGSKKKWIRCGDSDSPSKAGQVKDTSRPRSATSPSKPVITSRSTVSSSSTPKPEPSTLPGAAKPRREIGG